MQITYKNISNFSWIRVLVSKSELSGSGGDGSEKYEIIEY